MINIKEAKAQALEQKLIVKAEKTRIRRIERAVSKERRRQQRACFWTFPWGHVWRGWESGDPSYMQKECVVCGCQIFNYPDWSAGY